MTLSKNVEFNKKKDKLEVMSKYNGFESVVPKLSDGTLKFIREDLKFKFMSPVQEATIPELLRHRDVAVEACTGSGKTISYLVPVIEILLKSKVNDRGLSKFNIGSLILSPTRELSMQIYSILSSYVLKINKVEKKTNIKSIICIGGDKISKILDYVKEEGESHSSHDSSPVSLYYVLVGTPGRVYHMFQSLKDGIDWNVKSCLEILVLDEADRLLDMGFEKHINIILHSLPKQRRTGLFSATLNTQVENLIKTGLRNPRYIKVTIESPKENNFNLINSDKSHELNKINEKECDISVPTGLASYYIEIKNVQKIEFLIRFLTKNISSNMKTKCIIFFLTCNSVEFYFKFLSKMFHLHKNKDDNLELNNGYVYDTSIGKLCKLHGKMYQKSREKSYEIFKECDKGVLISTDLTARGIDVPNIEWIIQFDAPQDPSYYIHRIGRTARAGKCGKSIIMLQPHETAFINYIENKTMKKIKFYSHLENNNNDESEYNYNSIDDEYFNGGNLLYCDCINDKVDKKLLEKDEFICNESNYGRSALIYMRKMLLCDSDFYLTAKKAFVSYVRAYKEYQLSFIFPFKNLSIGEIASSFALFKIPRIKEILGKSNITKDFITQSNVINPDELFNLKQNKSTKNPSTYGKQEIEKHIANTSKGVNLNLKERSRSEKRAVKRKIEIDEWKTLCFEDKLAKKLKSGKITYQEYENKLKEFYSDINNRFDFENEHECNYFNEKTSDIQINNRKTSSDNRIPKWIINNKKNRKKK
ncbi:Spb4p [Cryptosporidium ryanae]|uniref:Spb4p n=1 Tax=Cryptosporidium ryanae TaxID=515981 RepID=UPI00351A36D8|nr:Spb4p [Cryptosporidium ryanae]